MTVEFRANKVLGPMPRFHRGLTAMPQQLISVLKPETVSSGTVIGWYDNANHGYVVIRSRCLLVFQGDKCCRVDYDEITELILPIEFHSAIVLSIKLRNGDIVAVPWVGDGWPNKYICEFARFLMRVSNSSPVRLENLGP